MKSVEGKKVLITGAAMGMGKLFAQKCVAEGAQVILLDINQSELNETVNELRDGGGNVHAYVVDLSDWQSIDRCASEILRDIGSVDMLINNAGIVVGDYFIEHSAIAIEKTMSINTNALMHLVRHFLPGMLVKNDAHIVNFSSAAAYITSPKMSVYIASKWAVYGWSESLRLELERESHRQVKVTTITPGYIDTGMFEGVQSPTIVPLLNPEKFVEKAWKGIKKDKLFVREPFIVKFLPLFRGILPTRAFDALSKVLGMHKSMDAHVGRKDTRQAS